MRPVVRHPVSPGTPPELATRSGLSISAIRFYQRRGLLPPRQSGSTWQRYGPDIVNRLAVIELAKRTGFTLDEIITILDAVDTADSPAPAWQAMATDKLAEIDAQVARLHHMRGLLAEALACSCLTLDRAALIPAALGWATDVAKGPANADAATASMPTASTHPTVAAPTSSRSESWRIASGRTQ
jgi:MerR family redox-sensitive transcriptional activator SoxR